MASCQMGTTSTLLHLDAQVMGGQRVTTVATKEELTEFIQSTILKRQEFEECWRLLVEELDKIRKWHPKSDLLIRIKPPVDSGAKYPLDSKCGAGHHPQEIMPLLKAAEASGLSVVGVSFHVGSDATNFAAFRGAIAAAKAVFDTAARMSNNKMRVLDIGGGFSFTNSNPKLFQEAASIIKEALQAYFSNELLPGSSLRVISVPGRFFTGSAFTLIHSNYREACSW
ncbi:hypothetical protein WN944_015892 [Citrus x changshan-huyou]|uniref:Orn/DAP/Arg decarboxylase 2 N-terminal domain-containing protein n=1 Tax=Citrus x changshan-huyou TaxID=2935761 RepID=A0AAP0M8E5_9ROSI